MREKVLVTGASGFVAGYVILELLERGYDVCGTLRSLRRADEVRGWLARARGAPIGEELSFVEADLGSDAGWDDAMRGVRWVQHIASPVPPHQPKDPDELIVPAREGTLRVLRAAHAAKVKRVVQTSSTAAVAYGQPRSASRASTEDDWTDPSHPETTPYVRSKVIAERAAWAELEKLGGTLEWVAINPSLVLGPILGKDTSPSVAVVSKLLNGEVPGVPRFGWPTVDVRDLAVLHVLAMTEPAAAGERFIASGDFHWMSEVAETLKAGLGDDARRVPSRTLPNFAVRIFALFDGEIRGQLSELGRTRAVAYDKAERVFGWRTRPFAETVLDTARSLKEHGALRAP